MRQIQYAFICCCLAFVLVETRVQLHRSLPSKADIESLSDHYIFPRARAVHRQPNFAELDVEAEDYDENVAEENDAFDEEDMHSQDLQAMPLKHRTTNDLSLPKEHAGGILVPDGIIEVAGETIYDEKTGQATLVVPRKALEAIPEGSIVALLENESKSKAEIDEDDAEERANRVYVRRRNTGSRIKVRAGTKKTNKKRGSSAQKNRLRRRRPQTEIWDLSNINTQSLRRRPSSNNKKRPTNNKRRQNPKGNRRTSTKKRRPVVRDYFSDDY